MTAIAGTIATAGRDRNRERPRADHGQRAAMEPSQQILEKAPSRRHRSRSRLSISRASKITGRDHRQKQQPANRSNSTPSRRSLTPINCRRSCSAHQCAEGAGETQRQRTKKKSEDIGCVAPSPKGGTLHFLICIPRYFWKPAP